jgi:hypothetical protein
MQKRNPATARRLGLWSTLGIVLLSAVLSLAAPVTELPREQAIKLVNQIRRADYEGDRPALQRLYAELAPFAENKDLASRVRYWRGFALWRRAINGFNDNVDPKEMEDDLKMAVEEFEESARKDPRFVDAKIGELSCLGFVAYLNKKDTARVQQYAAKMGPLMADIKAAEPENPRFLWVLGPRVWNTPEERGGGQVKTIEMYQKGLEIIRSRKTAASDPLEPAWGEPELLMSLAWSELNRTTPDLKAAEECACSALELVPYWHYVKNILLPQIEEARRKQN